MKKHFKLFDFFANCEYFEKEFNYDEVLELPQPSTSVKRPPPPPPIPDYERKEDDHVTQIEDIAIGLDGMKIDRMYFDQFEAKVKTDPDIKEKVAQGEWEELLAHIEKNILDKPDEYFTLERLRNAAQVDRRISLKEIVEKIFGMIPYFKTKEELLDEEFDKFDSRYLPKEEYFSYAKTVFKAYILDSKFRQIIDNKNFADLNVSPYGDAFKRLTPELRRLIPEYIKDCVSLNKFAA
jgi:type I restriction enzyme R subunit